MTDKWTEYNMAAASMLGMHYERLSNRATGSSVVMCHTFGSMRQFDLRTNHSDQYLAIKTLATKHGIGITANWNYEKDAFAGWNIDGKNGASIDGIDYLTYESAIGAACQYVMGVEDYD